MREMNGHFKWKRTFLYTFTGYPNSGKSELLLFMAALKAKKDGSRFMLYVPESMSSHEGIMTIDEVVDTLAHIIVGRSTDPDNDFQMSEEQYLDALNFINDHFVVLYPESPKPKDVLEYAQYIIDEDEKIGKTFYGLIIDPWNNLLSDQRANEMLDDYIMRELIGVKHFLIKNNIIGCVVVHPKSPPVGKDGKVPPANAFTLRGGAAFNNKSDGIVSVHRPHWFMESVIVNGKGISGRNSTRVEVHTFKMKNQKLVGVVLGFSEWEFNRITNRYENNKGISPFDEAYDWEEKMKELPDKKTYGSDPIQGSLDLVSDSSEDEKEVLDPDEDLPF